jgi:hypothetical protein
MRFEDFESFVAGGVLHEAAGGFVMFRCEHEMRWSDGCVLS